MYGFLGGTILGSVYGIAFVVVLGSIGSLLYGTGELSTKGVFIGTPFLVIGAAALGTIFGAPVGLLLGIVNGGLVVVLARAFFPLQDARRFRLAARAGCTVVSVVSATGGFHLVARRLGSTATYSIPLGIDPFFLIPVGIATSAAWWLSGRLANTAKAVAASLESGAAADLSIAAAPWAVAQAQPAWRMNLFVLLELLELIR